LVEQEVTAGKHLYRWDGKDNNGNAVSQGIYLYKLQAGSYYETKKMIWLK
jgi:flagellar hook assembly protein FlgD